jgi:sulfur carrier protein
MMTIVWNGTPEEVPGGVNLATLLADHGIDADTKGVAVAVGDTFIHRAQWGETSLHEGARVEVVTAFAGG